MKKIYLFLIVVTLLFAGVGFYIYNYGNPQWHRSIYMWQCYVTKKNVGEWEMIYPESSFTGTWRAWYSDGRLRARYEMVDGKRHGTCVHIHPNGSHFVTNMKNDLIDGERKVYDVYGVLQQTKWFIAGVEQSTPIQ